MSRWRHRVKDFASPFYQAKGKNNLLYDVPTTIPTNIYADRIIIM